MRNTSFNWAQTIEALGILSVVGSLFFVAWEIRQNTNVARSATVQAIAEQSYDGAMRIAENTELRNAYFAGNAGTASEAQRLQLQALYAALIRIQINRFEQIKLGIIDRDLALRIGGVTGTGQRMSGKHSHDRSTQQQVRLEHI